jgi:hypothetical protein
MKLSVFAVTVSLSLLSAACLAGDDVVDGDVAETSQEVSTTNGLRVINGLNTQNGLNSQNGLNTQNGLNSQNGLKDGVGLMTTDAGRATLDYLVKCALPAGKAIQKKDQTGKVHTFRGALGVGPGWETGQCSTVCQEWVSACMVAHINTAGINVPLWVVADPSYHPQIGWGLSTAFPNQEGSFFGNIFQSPPKMYYCNGRNFDVNAVPGRIGYDLSTKPYVNPFGYNARCDSYCTASDYPNGTSGYKACSGYNGVFTVWRK